MLLFTCIMTVFGLSYKQQMQIGEIAKGKVHNLHLHRYRSIR